MASLIILRTTKDNLPQSRSDNNDKLYIHDCIATYFYSFLIFLSFYNSVNINTRKMDVFRWECTNINYFFNLTHTQYIIYLMIHTAIFNATCIYISDKQIIFIMINSSKTQDKPCLYSLASSPYFWLLTSAIVTGLALAIGTLKFLADFLKTRLPALSDFQALMIEKSPCIASSSMQWRPPILRVFL